MNNQQDLMIFVQEFQDLANRHDVDKIMAMYADDAEFEIEGQFNLVGKKNIRAIFEYDAGVNTQIEFINCTTEGNAVICQILERNDRLQAIGISKLLYKSCVFIFKQGIIQKFTAAIEAESAQAVGEIWRAFLPWIAKHYPVEYSRMVTPEGRFIYNRKNGESVVGLLKEWRTSQGRVSE